jgi:hypothetical protein
LFRKGLPMLDILLLAAGLAGFALLALYIRAIGRV